MLPGKLEILLYGIASAALIGFGWLIYDTIGDRREAQIVKRFAEEAEKRQRDLDAVEVELAKAEDANRVLAGRLALTRKEIEDAIRADPASCRLPDGLRQRLLDRWSEDAAR